MGFAGVEGFVWLSQLQQQRPQVCDVPRDLAPDSGSSLDTGHMLFVRSFRVLLFVSQLSLALVVRSVARFARC